MDETLKKALKLATVERNTSFYESFFKKVTEDIKSDEIWVDTQKAKLLRLNQESLMERLEKFLERLQIKAYYYELAFRILCEVNLAEVKSSAHFENIRVHIELFSN